jgi:serine protease Do
VEEFLGITVQDLTPGLATYFGCPLDSGVVISNIESESPAEKSGLHNGDLITTLDEKSLKNLRDYHEILDRHEGEEISVTYCREKSDKPQTIQVKIDPAPKTKQGEEVGPWMGLTIHSIDNLIARKHGFELDAGVVVSKVEPDSPAADIGFRPGDLITDVGSYTINSIADYRKAVREYETTPPKVQVRVYRPGFQKPVVVVLERKET